MSFLQFLESRHASPASFRWVKSRFNRWHRLIGIVLMIVAFMLFGSWFMGVFQRKQVEWYTYVIFFGGIMLIRFVFVYLGEGYRVLGTIEATDDALVLTDTQNKTAERVLYDEMTYIGRSPGVALSGVRGARARTAHIEVRMKHRPGLVFESEWVASDRETGIEDLIQWIREYKQLPLFAERGI